MLQPKSDGLRRLLWKIARVSAIECADREANSSLLQFGRRDVSAIVGVILVRRQFQRPENHGNIPLLDLFDYLVGFGRLTKNNLHLLFVGEAIASRISRSRIAVTSTGSRPSITRIMASNFKSVWKPGC